MVPGRYRVTAKMEGFRSLERRGIIVEVGQTPTLDLTLDVGAIAETITVSGDTPLIDLTSAEIGGHISAEEVNELPAGNRSYMAFVGNVPGAQFVPTTGFLNDTMLANGQTSAANNVVFDGAGNIDDLRGSNVGGQTRTAERIGPGSAGPDQPVRRGVRPRVGRRHQRGDQVGHQPVHRVRVRLLHRQERDRRGLLHRRGTISRSRRSASRSGAAPSADRSSGTSCIFFGRLERLVQNRTSRRSFPRAPNTAFRRPTTCRPGTRSGASIIRSAPNNTWAFRWLKESAPQFNVLDGAGHDASNDDETDLDQTLVGDLDVGAVEYQGQYRAARRPTKEQTTHANRALRALDPAYASCIGLSRPDDRRPVAASADAGYLSFNAQADDTIDFSLDDAYSIDDTFSWFIPDKMGRHDTKFGCQVHAHLDQQPQQRATPTAPTAFRHDLPFNPADPRTIPERFSIRVPGPARLRADYAHLRAVRAGQVADQERT